VGVRLELEDLPPRYRAQAELQILQRKSGKQTQKRAENGKNRDGNAENRKPESEKRYYRDVILPKVACGLVVKVQEQIAFELLPEKAYCGLKLPKARYKPDFVLTYADGTVEIVEVKSRFTRRMQRDYIYRRRLFIDLVAEPRGWKFTEWYADKED
jgi:hypothetical protein